MSFNVLTSALVSQVRIEILALVREAPCTMGELARVLGLAPSTLTHHVGVLRRAGLVRSSRQNGREVIVESLVGDIELVVPPWTPPVPKDPADESR